MSKSFKFTACLMSRCSIWIHLERGRAVRCSPAVSADQNQRPGWAAWWTRFWNLGMSKPSRIWAVLHQFQHPNLWTAPCTPTPFCHVSPHFFLVPRPRPLPRPRPARDLTWLRRLSLGFSRTGPPHLGQTLGVVDQQSIQGNAIRQNDVPQFGSKPFFIFAHTQLSAAERSWTPHLTLLPRMVRWSMETGGLPFTVNLMFFMCTFIDMSTPGRGA